MGSPSKVFVKVNSKEVESILTVDGFIIDFYIWVSDIRRVFCCDAKIIYLVFDVLMESLLTANQSEINWSLVLMILD